MVCYCHVENCMNKEGEGVSYFRCPKDPVRESFVQCVLCRVGLLYIFSCNCGFCICRACMDYLAGRQQRYPACSNCLTPYTRNGVAEWLRNELVGVHNVVVGNQHILQRPPIRLIAEVHAQIIEISDDDDDDDEFDGGEAVLADYVEPEQEANTPHFEGENVMINPEDIVGNGPYMPEIYRAAYVEPEQPVMHVAGEMVMTNHEDVVGNDPYMPEIYRAAYVEPEQPVMHVAGEMIIINYEDVVDDGPVYDCNLQGGLS